MLSTNLVVQKIVKLMLAAMVVIAVVSIALQNVGRLTRVVLRLMHDPDAKALVADDSTAAPSRERAVSRRRA